MRHSLAFRSHVVHMYDTRIRKTPDDRTNPPMLFDRKASRVTCAGNVPRHLSLAHRKPADVRRVQSSLKDCRNMASPNASQTERLDNGPARMQLTRSMMQTTVSARCTPDRNDKQRTTMQANSIGSPHNSVAELESMCCIHCIREPHSCNHVHGRECR